MANAVAVPIRLATSWACRLRGLLGRAQHNDALLIVPCGDIHTFGMRGAIDVAFIDRGGVVCKALRNVQPGKRVRANTSEAVLERFTQSGDTWFQEGDRGSYDPQTDERGTL